MEHNMFNIYKLVGHNKWNIFHFDVKITFLNGDLKEDVYMT
jgi:hypothetical protein